MNLIMPNGKANRCKKVPVATAPSTLLRPSSAPGYVFVILLISMQLWQFLLNLKPEAHR
jgi:hypothetical protein